MFNWLQEMDLVSTIFVQKCFYALNKWLNSYSNSGGKRLFLNLGKKNKKKQTTNRPIIVVNFSIKNFNTNVDYYREERERERVTFR